MLRKKRNFKALQLDVKPVVAPPEPDPLPVQPVRPPPPVAPAAGGKKRPPPMTLKAPKIPPTTTQAEQETSLLTVNGASATNSPATSNSVSKRMTYHTHLSHTLANLDSKAETRFDLKNDDLKELQELGQGNGGSVKKVEHLPSGTIMAKKVRLLVWLGMPHLT